MLIAYIFNLTRLHSFHAVDSCMDQEVTNSIASIACNLRTIPSEKDNIGLVFKNTWFGVVFKNSWFWSDWNLFQSLIFQIFLCLQFPFRNTMIGKMNSQKSFIQSGLRSNNQRKSSSAINNKRIQPTFGFNANVSLSVINSKLACPVVGIDFSL